MRDFFRSWRERRKVLREVIAIEKEEARELPLSDRNPLLQAKLSLQVDDSVTALRCWRHAFVRYPTYVKQAPETLSVLLGLKLFNDAEAIMLEGQARSPNEARFAEGYALVAEHRGDLKEAVVRWQRVRKRFPGSWAAYANGARCLRQLGCMSEAERLLKHATSRFPQTINGWLEHARLAEDTKDWVQAQWRWEQVSHRFGHVLGYLGQARVMVALGHMEEAERILLDTREKFEYEPTAATAWAHLAELRGDHELALERWAFVRKRFPQFLPGYRESVRLLQETGKFAEFEALLNVAGERFPSEHWPQVDRLSLAHQQHD